MESNCDHIFNHRVSSGIMRAHSIEKHQDTGWMLIYLFSTLIFGGKSPGWRWRSCKCYLACNYLCIWACNSIYSLIIIHCNSISYYFWEIKSGCHYRGLNQWPPACREDAKWMNWVCLANISNHDYWFYSCFLGIMKSKNSAILIFLQIL